MKRDVSDNKDYDVAASFSRTFSGLVPRLKVTRLSDRRIIYPFAGCADMPVCADAETAIQFAETYGRQLVDGDIAVPE
jgi:hypothetical protein